MERFSILHQRTFKHFRVVDVFWCSITSAKNTEAVAGRCFVKGVVKNFTEFTGKHLCQNLFNKVAGLRPVYQVYVIKKSTKISKNKINTPNNNARVIQSLNYFYWVTFTWETKTWRKYLKLCYWQTTIVFPAAILSNAKEDKLNNCEPIHKLKRCAKLSILVVCVDPDYASETKCRRTWTGFSAKDTWLTKQRWKEWRIKKRSRFSIK